jgi:hypothetical protein
MRRKLRCCAAIAVLGIVAATAGCTFIGTVNCGGWFQSAFPGGGKVTFTLHGTFDTVNGTITAGGELHDHDLGVNAHLDGGVFEPTELEAGYFEYIVGKCLDEFHVPPAPNTSLFGFYTPKSSKPGPGGHSGAFVVDEDGSGNPSPGDSVVIVFTEGIYSGYANCGYLCGGNFQVTDSVVP